MIEVVETNDRLILVCSYKEEVFLLDDMLSITFPNATYSKGHYKENTAIYLNKDNGIPKEYQNCNELKYFINSNISRISS